MSATGTTTNVGTGLWVTVPGASRMLAVVWLAWMSVVLLAAPVAAARLGPAGTIVVVLAAGLLFAAEAPAPWAALRRYHLDDVEAVAMGPGRQVLRLPWTAV